MSKPQRVAAGDRPPGTEPTTWGKQLQEFVRASVPAPTPPGETLAIEFACSRTRRGAGAAYQLSVRPMCRGKNNKWVNKQLPWGEMRHRSAANGARRDHVELLEELSDIFLEAEKSSYGYYGYYGPSVRSAELGDKFDGARLWPLLSAAPKRGIVLTHSNQVLGEVPVRANGEILINITADEQGALLRPLLRIGGLEARELQLLTFIGTAGHGALCATKTDMERSEEPSDWRLQLVHLPAPASEQLRKMALRNVQVRIPSADLQRFRAEMLAGLCQAVPVISADDTFEIPRVSAPALQLRIRHTPERSIGLAWEWEYESSGAKIHLPLGATDDLFRDTQAERETIAGTPIPASALAAAGLLSDTGRAISAPEITLRAGDAFRFMRATIPQLDALGVRYRSEGEPPDFRDVSDSLQIAVSTAAVENERDWFDLGVSVSVEGREVPFAALFTALASGEDDMVLEDGAHFSLADERLQALRQLIEEARELMDPAAKQLQISRYQTDLWDQFARLGVVAEQAEQWRRHVDALAGLETLSSYEPPATLTATLRPYQREGFGWLASLQELALGGILADDMGLGKTVQTLALVARTRAIDPDSAPFLVIAPTSVAPNWADEAARFTPGLKVQVVLGTFAKSGRKLAEIAQADIVVTTYTLLRLDEDSYRTVTWAAMIFDEAQSVKNHQSKTYQAARRTPAAFKLAITGTPMENNLMELWSLLSITSPGLFPNPRHFQTRYARPIEQGDAERLAVLRRRIKPLVKRRTKELVAADLPPKQEQVLEVELHARHRRIYDVRLQRERQKVLGLLGDFNRNRFTILNSITVLRQLSIHPGLVDASHLSVPCAKLDALTEQLQDVVGGGHRALVFSQYTQFLGIVREQLDRKGIGYCYLDGRTNRRATVIQRFKNGTEPVFLISLKAGGFGLNLPEADYCVLLDPWWNPAVENQAVDRAHRIGQRRQVMVYRMVSRGTIEEKVVALAARKAKLFRGVMDDGDIFASAVTAEDIRGLLS